MIIKDSSAICSQAQRIRAAKKDISSKLKQNQLAQDTGLDLLLEIVIKTGESLDYIDVSELDISMSLETCARYLRILAGERMVELDQDNVRLTSKGHETISNFIKMSSG